MFYFCVVWPMNWNLNFVVDRFCARSRWRCMSAACRRVRTWTAKSCRSSCVRWRTARSATCATGLSSGTTWSSWSTSRTCTSSSSTTPAGSRPELCARRPHRLHQTVPSRPALLQSTTIGLSDQQTFIPQKTYPT